MKKVLLILAVLCFCASPALAAEEYSVQSFWGSAHHLNKVFWEAWCKDMTDKSGGKAVFHYYSLNTLVKSDGVATAIKAGNLDAGGIQMQTAVSMMPHSQVLGLPFLVQNAREACVLYAKMFETFPEMRDEVNKNFKLLAAFGSDRYAFASNNVLIKTPADLKGKRVLVWAAYQMDEVKSWGGQPVQIASSETYMGLQRGLGEVAYVPAPAVESNKLSEVAKNITLIPSRTLPMILAINHDSWKTLPKEVQKQVEETTGPKLSEFIGTELVKLTDGDMEKHKASGCTVYMLSLEEQKVFKDAAAEANNAYWADMLSRNGVKDPKAWIAKVEKLAAETFKR